MYVFIVHAVLMQIVILVSSHVPAHGWTNIVFVFQFVINHLGSGHKIGSQFELFPLSSTVKVN